MRIAGKAVTCAPDPLAVFDEFKGCFDGKFNREELYDR
jgi:hypothetical protein